MLCKSNSQELESITSPEAAARLPRHIGIIMDGNGRWAKARQLPRLTGHSQGKKTLETIAEEIRKLGIPYLTVFAFSSENWLRPLEEVNGLMALLREGIVRQGKLFIERKTRFRIIGEMSRLDPSLREEIETLMEKTAHFTEFNFTVALSYGARQEMVEGIKSIAQRVAEGKLALDHIDEKVVSEHLYTQGMPDPDLIIRTSGEQRLSNFLLWQIAYAEIAFVNHYWPDFSEEELHTVLRDYINRERRYGKTSEQL